MHRCRKLTLAQTDAFYEYHVFRIAAQDIFKKGLAGRVAAKAQAERNSLEVSANPGKDKKISCLHDCAQKVIYERVSEEKQAGRIL